MSTLLEGVVLKVSDMDMGLRWGKC